MNLNRKQLNALEDLDETSTEPEHTQAVGVKETKESFWPFHKLDNLRVDLYEGVSECGRGYVVLNFFEIFINIEHSKKEGYARWNLVHYSAFTPYKYKSIQNETLRKHF